MSLEEKLRRGERFSATMDEYTSKAHSRYMNINLHQSSGKPIGLGIIRVKGSLPADRAADMVTTKLREFGIEDGCHLVAVITDGARVMVKMGESFIAFQQLCIAHGIHLAVCDLLYKKKGRKKKKSVNARKTRASNVFQTLSGTESEEEEDQEDDSDDSTHDTDSEEEIEEESCWVIEEPVTDPIVFLPEVEAIINKVRTVVKIFTSSPNNNHTLQQEVVKLPARKGKELKLKLDCKTRWNTIVDVLERFVELKPAIKKALVDSSINKLSLFPKEPEETDKIDELLGALTIIRDGTVLLQGNDMNLATADEVREVFLHVE